MLKIVKTEALPEFEYFPQVKKKKQIFLHHTVSAIGKYVDDWFKADKGKSKVAVAYVVDKDGTVFELFNPEYWAYHIGKGATEKDNQNSIAIEIVNEGQLYWRDKEECFYWWIDSKNPYGKYMYKGTEKVTPLDEKWRNEKFFAPYTKAQIETVKELVGFLLNKFRSIKPQMIEDFDYHPDWSNFNGILMHCNARKDKTDLSPVFPLAELKKYLSNAHLVTLANVENLSFDEYKETDEFISNLRLNDFKIVQDKTTINTKRS